MIWYFFSLQNKYHSKSGYHLLPYRIITVLLTIFTMLYIIFPWLIYFINGSWYFLLIPFTYFALSTYSPLLWQLLVFFCVSMSLFLFCYICSFAVFLLLFSYLVMSDSLQPLNCSIPAFPILHCLSEFAQTHIHWVSDAIQPSQPLSPPSPLVSTFPSIRISFNESTLHIRWPKYWSFSFSVSPSNEYSELISFRIDWFDLAVQGTLKSLF